MAIPNIFFAFFLVQLHLAFGIVPLNKTLSTNDQNASWLSPSREFAFGFRKINNSTNLFLVAIWFDKIPNRTIVWNADIQAPILLGSMVQLTTMGLSLINPQGQRIYMWPTGLQDDVSYAEMHDDGNFVLASSNSSYLWQSFNNPTDTLLPNQTLPLNGVLSSRLSQTNYTKGRFELYFDNAPDLLLSQIGWPTESRYPSYFSVDTSSATNDNDSALQLVFDASNVYVETRGGGRKDLGSGWSTSNLHLDIFYYRATLDYYGVFTLYSHPKQSFNQVWSVVTNVPPDICQAKPNDVGSGSCGYNSYCTWDDYSRRPTCNCPGGYSWVDPNDTFGGCKPDFPLGCGTDEVYDVEYLPDVNWPYGDYEKLVNYTVEQCKNSCLQDCNCAAFVSNTIRECWKKRLPLSNGRRGDTGQGFTTSVFKKRIQPEVYPNPAQETKEDRVQLALLGSLIGSLVIITLLVATVVSIILLKPKKVVKVSSFVETNMHSFTYEALKEATHGFSEEVGRGSFGIVYKGTINSITNTVVAVKRLDRIARERETEFRNELSAIGRTCHKNLVRLIGFCDEEIHRLLVYEFMSNGTLAEILFKQPKPIWNLRVSLALGIARGLLYLHEECETSIIHCDIKPQNILIDAHFMPKISDFGLAKLLYSDKSRTHTMIRGTRGYVAPEWFKNTPITAKVDTYSYGVMLLEIICCRRSLEMDMDEVKEGEAILIDWVYDCYMEGRVEILVEDDKEAMADIGRVKKWVTIAIWCIQENPETRPSMKNVMQMLEGLVEVPIPPTPSSFISSL